jgi:hypothetical protein
MLGHVGKHNKQEVFPGFPTYSTLKSRCKSTLSYCAFRFLVFCGQCAVEIRQRAVPRARLTATVPRYHLHVVLDR